MKLPYYYDLLFDIKTVEQLKTEADYLLERLSDILELDSNIKTDLLKHIELKIKTLLGENI